MSLVRAVIKVAPAIVDSTNSEQFIGNKGFVKTAVKPFVMTKDHWASTPVPEK